MLSFLRCSTATSSNTIATALRQRAAVTVSVANACNVRFLSDNANADPAPFRPRRRGSKNYRPLKARPLRKKGPIDPITLVEPGDGKVVLGAHPSDDPLEADFGPLAADAIRYIEKERKERGGKPLDVEEELRMADYLTTEIGTTEHMVGERRALALTAWDEKDRSTFMKNLEEFLEEERKNEIIREDEDQEEEGSELQLPEEEEEEDEQEVNAQGEVQDPNQLAFGEWGDCIIRVDRVNKVQRGGTLVRYRSLVIGGNANGCAGFGIGKANSPKEATEVATRMCRRNIFFIDRYQGSGLTRDLAGRHNSCKVILRAVQPNRGLRGHPLVEQILLYFGISDCSAKTHGNRNIYNVVRATFKAIMTHESMEEIALKRGKRLINMERAKRLQI